MKGRMKEEARSLALLNYSMGSRDWSLGLEEMYSAAKTHLETRGALLLCLFLAMVFGLLALLWRSCSSHERHLGTGKWAYNLFVLVPLFFLGFRVRRLTRLCDEFAGLLAQCRKASPDSQPGFCFNGVSCDVCSSKLRSWKDCPRESSITGKGEKELLQKFEENEREEREGDEEEEEWFSQGREDDMMNLRGEIAKERKLRAAVVMELEKERWAASSAADEALAKILQLQTEKGLIEREARWYRKMAEQKQVYDQEVIRSLQWLILKHEAERGEFGDAVTSRA